MAYLNELVGGLQRGTGIPFQGHVAVGVDEPVAHLEVVVLLRGVQSGVVDVVARHHGVAHLRQAGHDGVVQRRAQRAARHDHLGERERE